MSSDPTKVVRAALQGAASVAGLLITTEAMVAEKDSKPPTGCPRRLEFGDADGSQIGVFRDTGRWTTRRLGALITGGASA
jgi:hypothetical protein